MSILAQTYRWRRHLLGLRGKDRERSTPDRGNSMYSGSGMEVNVMFEHLKEMNEGDVEMGWRRKEVACTGSVQPW